MIMWHSSISRVVALLFLAILIFIDIQSAFSASRPDSWPVFQHDARHSGQTSLKGPSYPALKWMIPLGNKARTTTPLAVASNGSVYLGIVSSENKKAYSGVLAFDNKSKLLWKSKEKGVVSGSLAIEGDETIYANIGSKLTALNIKDGSTRWQVPFDDESAGGIVLDENGNIYMISTDSGTMYAVTPKGQIKWKYASGTKIENPPAIGIDGTIYATSVDLRLFAVGKEGALKWRRKVTNIAQTVLTAPAIAKDGTIYFGAIKDAGYVNAADNNKPIKQNLYAYNSNGSKKWTYESDSKEVMMPAITDDGSIITTSSSVNYAGEKVAEIGAAYVMSINPDGKLRWRWRVPDNELVGSPVVDSTGAIYISSASGNMICMSKDGVMKWRLAAGVKIVVGPGNMVYSVSNNSIVAVGERDFKKAVGDGKNDDISQADDGRTSMVICLIPLAVLAGIALIYRFKQSVNKPD